MVSETIEPRKTEKKIEENFLLEFKTIDFCGGKYLPKLIALACRKNELRWNSTPLVCVISKQFKMGYFCAIS